jgi:hypothetical protein
MRWTKQELDFIKENFDKMTHHEISEKIHRSQGAIRTKCSDLGLVNRNKYWTKDEVELLRQYYSKAGNAAPINLINLSKLLGRNKSNVCRKAKELGYETNQARPMTGEAKKNMSLASKKQIADKGHPRGMLGKTQSDEFKNKMSKRVKNEWKDPNSKHNSEENKQKSSDLMVERLKSDTRLRRGYSRGNQGRRADLNNRYFRSSWEANYARYLNFLIKQKQLFRWEYEPDTFWFESIKRGVRSYLPDFKLWDNEDSIPYYVEVKGWMDSKSKTKLSRMAKYYPDIKVIVVGATEYKEISKFKALISDWE